MPRYQVYVHEVVGLWVEVEAESKGEARDLAAQPENWIDWQEVPDVVHVWVPRSEKAEEVERGATD